jgi:hypothetical protein
MAEVTITLNQLTDRDPALGRLIEGEVARGAASAPQPETGGLRCRILAWGRNTVSVQLELPGWTKVLSVPRPLEQGQVRAAVEATLGIRVLEAQERRRTARALGTEHAVTDDGGLSLR